MMDSVERYTSASVKKRAGIVRGRILRVILIALILYLALTRFVASTFSVDSVSMKPGISPGDRIVVSSLSYGGRLPFSTKRLPGIEKPARGDLVVVRAPFPAEPGILQKTLEPFVSFFTLQKATLHRELSGARVNALLLKRVVGIPGDTVRLSEFSLLIKARGASDFVPELQLQPGAYALLTKQSARGWSSTFPFSGNGAEVRLGEDQYFVLGDNRPESSDSRSWGAVGADSIIAKAVYRYWPPRSFGKL
jgi:signal peptidase I